MKKIERDSEVGDQNAKSLFAYKKLGKNVSFKLAVNVRVFARQCTSIGQPNIRLCCCVRFDAFDLHCRGFNLVVKFVAARPPCEL